MKPPFATGSGSGDAGDPAARGERLIRQAFDQAREAGKEDWSSMRSAVLKNRILSLDADFTERDWGVDSFAAFLALHDDIVSVDTTFRPPIIQLRDVAAAVAPSGTSTPPKAWRGPQTRIRSDLWLAIMDVDASEPYYWDGATARQGATSPEQPALPTATADDLAAWRSEFVEAAKDAYGASFTEERLRRWATEVRSARVLPHFVRADWMTSLKRHVQERLETWFVDQGISPPADMVVDTTRERNVDTEIDQMRRLVVRVVEKMSQKELEELQLPASALLRARI